MRYLMITLLSFCAGAVLTLPVLRHLAMAPLFILAGLLLVCGLLLLLLRWAKERRLGLIFLFGAMGILFGCGYHQHNVAPALALAGQKTVCTCEAVSYSEETSHGIQVEAKLFTGDRSVRTTVWLYADEALKPGDRFTAELTLSDSAEDGSWYSYADGIYLTASGSELDTLEPCQTVPLRYLPARICHILEQSVQACFPEDVVGYAAALTTGNRSLMTTAEKSILQRAGIYHALALSGMHMSVLVGCLVLLKRRRKLRALLGIPLCLAFAVITGAGPSVVRAAVLQCMLLLGSASRRETDPPTSLSAAAWLLIIQNPWAVLSWGAQLSFASVIGLLLWGKKLYLWMRKLCRNRRLLKLWAVPASAFSASLSAMALTVPLMAYDFGYVSVIAPITNLFCGWMVSICFAGSLVTALLGLLSTAAAAPLGAVIAWGFRYVSAVSSLLSRIPFSTIYSSCWYLQLWLVLLYVVIVLLLLRPKIPKCIPICCTVCSFLLCILLTILDGLTPSFTAIDVDQGQCLLFRAGGGTVMVDCGSTRADAGELAADYLASVGEPDLDLLVLTHFDADHCNGVTDLLSRTTIHMLAVPDIDCEARAELSAAAAEAGTTVCVIRQDTTIRLGDGAISLFAPVGSDSSNDSGLSLLSQLPGLKVLVTGDMDADTEQALLDSHVLPDIDLLVAGHHGSKSSTGDALLDAVTPEAAVISVGVNSYGQPADETLARLKQHQITVYRTDEAGSSGAVTFRAGAF